MRCFTDQLGVQRIDVSPLPATIASFLELDIQRSVILADELIAALDGVASGAAQKWEITSDTYSVILSPDGVSIDCVWGDDNCTVSLAEFRKAAAAWRSFITGPIAL